MSNIVDKARELANKAVAEIGGDKSKVDQALVRLAFRLDELLQDHVGDREAMLDEVGRIVKEGTKSLQLDDHTVVAPTIAGEWKDVLHDTWPHLDDEHNGIALVRLGFFMGYDTACYTTLNMMKEHHKQMNPANVAASYMSETRRQIESLAEEVAGSAHEIMKMLHMHREDSDEAEKEGTKYVGRKIH